MAKVGENVFTIGKAIFWRQCYEIVNCPNVEHLISIYIMSCWKIYISD